MKKILVLFATLFIGIVAVYADTKTINWKIGDTIYDTTTCTVGGDLILPTNPTKYGYTFQGWRNYIPIEYIESTGAQYIDTGFKPNNDTRFIISYMIPNNNNLVSTRGVASVRNGYLQAQFGIEDEKNGKYRSSYNNQIKYENSFAYNKKLTADKNKNITTWYDDNGAFLATIAHDTVSFQTSYNLPLFSLNDGGTQYIMPCKIYSFQLYDNGTLVRNMIPVLDKDDVACMYDKVSGTFFYNAGTGDFIAGPVISE